MSETINLLNFPEAYKNDITTFSQSELDLFMETFLEVQSNYSFVCIDKDIHKQFHDIYGYGDNNEKQWREFVDKFYK